MRDLYENYVNVELQVLARSQNYYDTAMMDITKIDPEVDENGFVRDTLGSIPATAPTTEFTFLPWTGGTDSHTIDTVNHRGTRTYMELILGCIGWNVGAQ
jgi:hypothetical protein